jgi:hypothetical protein
MGPEDFSVSDKFPYPQILQCTYSHVFMIKIVSQKFILQCNVTKPYTFSFLPSCQDT